MLLILYKNYLSPNRVESESGQAIYYFNEQDYEELKKITISLYQNDENFGSKIIQGVDITVYGKKSTA